MKLSLKWLQRYLALDVSVESLTEALTLLGFEVESVEKKGLVPLTNVVVGEVLDMQQHPNADRLKVCKVRVDADNVRQIVCGATNYEVGSKVPVALPGAILPGGVAIKEAALRGVPSSGMMCSAKELGANEDAKGLWILPKDAPIGVPLNQYLGEGDVILDLSIGANRGDALSHIGIARELAAWFKLPVVVPDIETPSAFSPTWSHCENQVPVKVETLHCPFYVAWKLEDIVVGPSPDWLKNALEAVGSRSINNVVDITNWVMLECGQPLHAFDAAKVQGALCVRTAKAGELLTLIDGTTRTLDVETVIIADSERPLAVAGIMGGSYAEITPQTTSVILESAIFNPDCIRKTTQKLGLMSDSAYRFARDIDPENVDIAARRAVDLMLHFAKARVVCAAVVGKPHRGKRVIAVTPEFIRQKLGFGPENNDVIVDSFERLGFVVDKSKPEWQVTVPSYRADVSLPIDLVEEFLRLYGTTRIPHAPVQVQVNECRSARMYACLRSVRQNLRANDFCECYHYTLMSQKTVETLWPQTAPLLKLSNPLNQDQSHLRPSLLTGLLETMKYNLDEGNVVRRLFECGRVFVPHNGAIEEKSSIACLLRDAPEERSWKQGVQTDFFAIKRVVQLLLAELGVACTDCMWRGLEEDVYFINDHAAMYVDDGIVAKIGALDPMKTQKMGIAGVVYAAEIIFPSHIVEHMTRPPHRGFCCHQYPAVGRDLAVIVDQNVRAADVIADLTAVSKQVAPMFTCARVFDVYAGEGVPSGKKSLACALTFRSNERTLNDAEVNAWFAKIQTDMQAKGYSLRI